MRRIPAFILICLFFMAFAASSGAQELKSGNDGQNKAASFLETFPRGRYGLSLQFGLGLVKDTYFQPGRVNDTLTTISAMPSGQFGFFYTLYFGKHSFLTVEPGVTLIQGGGRSSVETSAGELTWEVRKRLYFLSLPVSWGMNFGRFGFSLGVQPAFQFFGQAQTNKVLVSGNNSNHGSSDYTNLKYHPFDIGLSAEISYQVYHRMTLFLDGYYGLLDVHRPVVAAPSTPQWYTRAFALGIKYPIDKPRK